MIGIYKVTNPKGAIYIGKSKDIKRRFNQYRKLDCEGQHKLYRSLKKYGVENHKFEIITECDVKDLSNLERYYQDLYDACGANGLNLSLTASDERHYEHNPETIKKISEKLKGREPWNKGKKMSDESRKKNSDFKKELYASGHPHPMKGRKHSEEHKLKIRQNHYSKKEGYKHPTKGKISLNSKISKIVLDTETGFFYISGVEAYYYNKDYLKMGKITFLSKLNGANKNNTKFQYI